MVILVAVICLGAGFAAGYYVKKVGAKAALQSVQETGGKIEDLAKRL